MRRFDRRTARIWAWTVTIVCYAAIAICIFLLPFDILRHRWWLAVLRSLGLALNAFSAVRVIPRIWRGLRELESLEQIVADMKHSLRMWKRHALN